jgi:MATE family multidrug resistance protein
MAGIFQLSDGMQAVGAGILRGLTDVKITMVYAFIAYICINIPLAYILAFPIGFGAIGVWAAFIFGLSVAAILFRLRYMKNFRRLKAEFGN